MKGVFEGTDHREALKEKKQKLGTVRSSHSHKHDQPCSFGPVPFGDSILDTFSIASKSIETASEERYGFYHNEER